MYGNRIDIDGITMSSYCRYSVNCPYSTTATLYSKCDQASDPMDWGRKWLVDFHAGKAQLVPFDSVITLVLLM